MDYNGVKTAYTYDGQDRIIKEQTGDEYTSYEYDAYGRLAGLKTKDSEITYTYNKYGELEQKTYENGEAVKYLYDRYGRTSEIQVLSGEKVQASTKYEYDRMNRLTRVVGRNGEATVYTYDACGNRETAVFANGVKLTYTYDVLNRLTLQKAVDSRGETVAQYRYTLGKNGQRTRTEEEGPDGTVTTDYGYDEANRLVKETIRTDAGKTTYEYSYDKAGNRTCKETDGVKTYYTYDSRNRLETEKTGNSVTTFHYDANGSLLKQSGGTDTVYTYDVYSRLTGYRKGTQEESYTYDAEGARRSRTAGSAENSTVYFVSDTSGSLSRTLAETDGRGTVRAEYTADGTLTAQTRDGEVSWYLYDGHGDVRGLLDAEGRVTDTYRYSAYGELLEKTGDTENHYLYTGEYYDGMSGLYYLRARYMNPSTGTFLTMDTYEGSIYEPATLHKYLYANGNPVTYSDPGGHFAGLVGCMVSITARTIAENYQTLHTLGMISGMMNSVITAFLGGSGVEIGEAFIKGYLTGFGVGAVMYIAAAFEIMAIAQMCMLMAASNTVMSVVLTIVAASSGNTKAALVYGTLSILSFCTFCKLYNANCTVDVVGNKGTVRVEFDNSDPYSPKLNNKKITVGTPYETGVDGENYVAGQLGMEHNTTPVEVNNRNRIPDFYSKSEHLVVEVKNVEKQSYTSQLKDYVQLAQDNGTVLILYVRKNTVLTGPLQEAVNQGLIELRYFPW